jgi:molybdenum cofactor cytidylyltransferase
LKDKVGAVILAAGGSARLGFPKQLIQYRGKTLVRRAIDTVESVPCRPLILVVGSHADEVSKEARGTSCLIVPNPDWEAGLGTSIRAGLNAALEIEPELRALFLLLCDQYAVNKDHLRALIKTRMDIACAIVASEYSGTIGVPAVFDRSCFAELLALPDDSGAKSVILKDRARVGAVSFPEGTADVDSPEDVDGLL